MLGKSETREVFLARIFDKLNDRRTKSCPNLAKLCRHDHKGLVNISTKGIDESLHGLGGIDEFPSKNGFSQKRKNVNSRELVNPMSFALGKRAWIHHKEL